MGFYQLHKTQKIPANLGEVWNFISSPANLKKITPEYMGVKIQSRGIPKQEPENLNHLGTMKTLGAKIRDENSEVHL